MSQNAQINKPLSLVLDKNYKYLSDSEAYYLLNHERYVNIHGLKSDGATIGKTTPFPANYPACGLEQPAGETYCIGTYRSPITNEVYSWHYNTNGVHYILRITDNGCEIVNDNPCLKLSADPRHSIENWRAYLKVDKFDKDCGNQHGKQLVWTDGTDEGIWQVDVEASIATNSFRTPFFDLCSVDGCEAMKMCVPQPCGCLQAEYVTLPESERSLTNHIIDVGFKFMYRFVYYDNRASEWSDRSTLYYQDVKGCFDSAEGFPRCMRLRIPIGNPLVEKIEIAFTKGDNIWYITDTVDKYKKYTNSQQKWYERELSNLVRDTFSESDCCFDYIFCNDKQCQTIDPKEITRVFNPQPRKPQGLIPIKNALGFYNYEKGMCPVDRKEIEKITVERDCPEINTECTAENVKVRVRAVIHNTTHDRNQFVFIEEDDAADTAHTAKFGGLNPSLDGGYEDPLPYDQYFNDKVRDFIAYIEGTEYWVEMKQYKANAFFDSPELTGVVTGMDSVHTRNKWRRAARHGEFFFQEAEFTVPKGTKGFIRLASHHATGNEPDTSTFVMGVLPNIYTYKGDGGLEDFRPNDEEIWFDTCSADVKDGVLEVYEVLVIQDNAVDKGGVVERKASAYHGYIKDENGRPVEGAVIGLVVPIVAVEIPFSTTDHNGFYHFYSESGINGDVDIKIRVEKDCSNFDLIKTVTISGQSGENAQRDIRISKDDSLPYQTGSQLLVKVPVVDCDGKGVGGIRVALSGSKYAITHANGIAEFKIRNYSSRARNIRAVIMDYKNCFSISCNGECNPCMPSTNIEATPACYATDQVQIITLSSLKINKASAIINRKGLKNGGRYPIGVVIEGTCDGRLSSVYDIRYIDIPKAQESGGVRYCGLKYNATGVKLPSWGTCFKFVRGKNVNPFELQWIVDKIQRTPDGKIKLTIQSLNDYNAKYNFKANTKYQYLKGDRIEFIKNGDGKIFSTSKYGLLNYLAISPFHDEVESGQKNEDVEADFFNQLLIEDDGKLTDLKEGAVIEMQRSKECVTEPEYYEVCATIPIVNGELTEPSGTFFTFDTYLVNRSIGAFPAQAFEHHSPSDFWGDKIDDTGKAHFVNKYENEKRYGRNISINAPNQFNYFGDLEKTFDAPEQGDIVAMDIKDGKIILAIGENDNFIAQTADELVRVGSDGIIRALPADAIISDGQPKVFGKFGCQYAHIGSIFFGDGWARWVDVNRHTDVIHDYSVAKMAGTRVEQDGTVITLCASYFRKRCQEIETHNRKQTNFLNHFRFVTGFNNHSGVLMSTIKKLRDSGIYNEKEPYKKPNDTILYHPVSDDYRTLASFTPEAYSHIDLFDGNGCAFITFLNGQPYIHPFISDDKWNEFYGVAVDRVIGISLNKFPTKIKKGIAIELQDEMMWFVSSVQTEIFNYKSEIPPSMWEKTENKWNAAFLGNINGHGGLFGDEGARGYYVNVVFVRDNSDALKYNSIDDKKRIKYDELDAILFKFMASEQSGFTENL